MNAKKLNIVLIIALAALAAVIVYQNFISDDTAAQISGTGEETQLWTCGMHPEIISEEPGNCPICGMKLTPVKNSKSSSSGEREILYWVAPMDPNEIYDAPGKSKMGMDLVPVYADEAAPDGVVTIDPAVQQTMNVKFTTIEKRKLDPSIETSAVITTDERKERQINTRFGGWVEKLYVNFAGQQVAKGQKLLEIYSPELVAAQQEYLTALKYKNNISRNNNNAVAQSGVDLLKNARQKLELLKMTSAEIDELENAGEVKTNIPLYSPVSGTVLTKDIIEGEKISAGQNLLLIADLSTLWIKADLYESDITSVDIGDPAVIKVNAYPDLQFEGKVSFVYPTISSSTRTVQARIDVANKDYKLKPSMLANVTIYTGEKDEAAAIPETAVIRSGQNSVAILYVGDGKFKPVQVELGKYSDGYYRVLSGLSEGNKVVTSAQFLIDSESSLKSAMNNFTSAEPAEDEMKMDNETGQIEEAHLNEYGVDSPLIRTGVIDPESLDENGDGKLFECPMDWNVLADGYHKCPVCNMKMKEYTIEEVKANLAKHGYEYK